MTGPWMHLHVCGKSVGQGLSAELQQSKFLGSSHIHCLEDAGASCTVSKIQDMLGAGAWRSCRAAG